MGRYQVTTPAGTPTKKIVGVNFADGVAVVDEQADRKALAYFRRAGYRVEAIDAPTPAEEPVESAPVRPKTSANKPEWVAYAVSQGVPADEAEKLTKDELIARFPEGGVQ